VRYMLKQKILAWGDDFTIQDDQGRDVFLIDGKAFSLRKQLSFQDMNGQQLAFIRQRLLAWGPTYEIYIDGELHTEIRKELFSFFKARFTVDVPGPDDLEAEGDFLHHEYHFQRHGRTVATVSKQWFSWADTYGAEIADEKDVLTVLCAAVVIDLACHDRKD
jgi:uncharacterized protein YxjI